MNTNRIIWAALLLAAQQASASTNEAYQIESPIIVSATRIDTPIEQLGSAVSVVDQQAILKQGAPTTQSALRQMQGIQFSNNGGPGTASSTYIRGANGNHTLFLINGIRINSNTTGDFNLSNLPADSIERVELLRGPQSALYGSDAIGGVVNIITKKGNNQPVSTSLFGAYGEKNFYRGSINLNLASDEMDVSATLATAGLRDYDIAKNYGGNEDDPYRSESFHGNWGINLADDGRIDLSVLSVKTKNDLDQNAPWPNYWQVDHLTRSSQNDLLVASAKIEKSLSDSWVQKLIAGYTDSQTEGEANGAQEYLYNTKNYDLSAQADLYLPANHTLSIGYDFRRSEAENKGNYSVNHRTQNALFIHDTIAINEVLFFNLGGRYDDFSDVDGRGTWKAAYSCLPASFIRLHGSAGTAYKAPTMNDLYWPTVVYPPEWGGGGTGGNPDLQSERSLAYDTGLELAFFDRKIVTDATLFYNEIKNLIEWAPDNTGFWSPRNVSAATTKGVETFLELAPLEWFSTRAHYTYTDAKSDETKRELARRAKHTAGLLFQLEILQYLSFHTDIVYVGERFDNATNTRKMDDYILVHFNLTGHLTDQWDVILNIDNAFDKEYENAAGYGTVGRVVSLGTSLTF